MSAASKLRSRLAEIEAQIALLGMERELVLGDLVSIVYPVLTLPNEITSEIFLQYVEEHPHHSPIRLASVCRLWRAVALSTCRLWTQLSSGDMITCHPEHDPEYDTDNHAHVANLLQCWLPRAGGLPLDLQIKLPASPSRVSNAILRAPCQYSSQWRTLHLISVKLGSIVLPALESLDVDDCRTNIELGPLVGEDDGCKWRGEAQVFHALV